MIPSTDIDIHDLLADVLGARGIIGCPPEIAVDALRKTAIDFCTQSTIWEFKNKFEVQYNVGDYPIEVPEGSRLASMRWVSINGYLLTPNTTSTQTLQRPYWYSPQTVNPNTWYANGQGYSFTMDGRDWFFISPVPVDFNCRDEVEWCAALKPTQNSCSLPKILYEDWNDALTSGAAYRLLSMAKQEWSNSSLAMQSRKEYQMWIARARLVKAQNFTQSAIVMSGSYF